MTESSPEIADEESTRHEKSDLEDDKDLIDRKEFLSPSLPTVTIMPTRRTINKGKMQLTFLCQVSSYLIYMCALNIYNWDTLCMHYLQRLKCMQGRHPQVDFVPTI